MKTNLFVSLSVTLLLSSCASAPIAKTPVVELSKVELPPVVNIENSGMSENETPIDRLIADKQGKAKEVDAKKGFSGHFLGKRYELVVSDEPLSWSEANQKALDVGGQLACFDTAEKYSYIQYRRFMMNNRIPAWVGLSDTEKEGEWQWGCNNREVNLKVISWLNKGQNLDNRDFGHLTKSTQRKQAFMSRTNSGDKPEFMEDPRAASFISAYVVEFDEAIKDDELDIISRKYQQRSPSLYSKVEAVKKSISAWGGRSGILTEAQKELDAILAIDDGFVPAIHALAKVKVAQGMVHSNYYRRSKINEAKSYLYKAIKFEPDYGMAYLTLSDTLVKARRYDEAKAALFNAANKGVSELQLNGSWGYLYQKRRKYNQAKVFFRYILKNQRDETSKLYINALSGMNAVHISKQHYSKAISGYEKLIDLKPESAWARGNYASFLFYTYKDIDAAIDYAEQAISILDYGMAREILAFGYYTKWHRLAGVLGAEEEAKKYFSQAFALAPDLERVIGKLSKYSHTKPTAAALQAWLIEHGEELSRKSSMSST